MIRRFPAIALEAVLILILGMTVCAFAEQEGNQGRARARSGGESLVDVAKRVRPVIKKIVKEHMGEEIIVVAHGGVNRIILLDAIGAPLESMFNIEQDYGCLNSIDYCEDGSTVVRLLNG